LEIVCCLVRVRCRRSAGIRRFLLWEETVLLIPFEESRVSLYGAARCTCISWPY